MEDEGVKLKVVKAYVAPDLYDRLRLYVFSRQMLDPHESMSAVIARALRDYFAREGEQQ